MSSNDLEIKFANQAPNRNINFPTDGRCVSAQANRVRESKVKRRTSLPKRPYNITSANGCSAKNFLFAMFSAVFGWCCLWPIDCVWIVFPFGEGDSALAHTFGSLKFRHQQPYSKIGTQNERYTFIGNITDVIGPFDSCKFHYKSGRTPLTCLPKAQLSAIPFYLHWFQVSTERKSAMSNCINICTI